MKTLKVVATFLTLAVLSTANAFAQHPGVDDVRSMLGTKWTGQIQQAESYNDEQWQANSGGCEIEIQSPTTVQIYTGHWRFHRKAVLTSGFGHGGADPTQAVAFGGTTFSHPNDDLAKDDLEDNGVVRLQWNSASEVEFQWWPDLKAQAGQRSHNPPYVSGKLTR